ncbi:MAG: hypothetical protein KBT72_11905 [Zhongshania sp.]|jgi:hypothetical protein|nr:hypothetical protein [Zhongshania sp.]
MKTLNAVILSTALSIASHAHAQTGLMSLPSELLGGILPGVLDLTNQSLPLVNGLLSNELVGGLVGDVVLPLTSDLLGPVLNGALPGLNSSLPMVDGLLSNQLLSSLVPLTSDLLGPVLNSALPAVLQTVDVVIPLVDGVMAGGIL